MNEEYERAAIVLLLRTGTRPWQHYADVVEQAGSALAVLEEETGPQQQLFAPHPDLDAAAAQVEQWRAEGLRLLTVLDEGYPQNLRGVHDRPPMIFVAGQLLPEDERSVAVVGTRQATPQGTAIATAIAEHLVACGYSVASGLAAGIDTAAHTAALAHKGRTFAVIGTGLRRVYPPQNAPLQRRIIRQGAVISQFWPDAPPSRRTFPMRNAVMSGMTRATVIVEASQTSGSRIQARLALEHARPVFLVRSLLAHDWAREFARRPGTYVVDRPSAITDTLERLATGSLQV
jgi:DNA processing protein